MASLDVEAWVKAYTPLMVLFPEIQPGTTRRGDRNPAFPEVAPLNHDYHPRGVNIVLSHSSLGGRTLLRPFGWPQRADWRQVLDDIESCGYERDLDVLKGVSSSDRDSFWSVYAGIDKDIPEYGRRCYARVRQGTGINADRTMIQYWYPYFYNDFWNTHEMDWELVMVMFTNDPEPQPVLCASSAHIGGHWLPWQEVQKADADGSRSETGTHPIIFVAHGSHANYFFGGRQHDMTLAAAQLIVGLLNPPVRVDFVMAFEEGARHIVEAALIPEPVDGVWPQGDSWEDDWRWLNQRGRWGSPGRRWDLKIGDHAPFGPPLQGQRWSAPFQWINTRCERAEDPTPPTRILPQR